MAVTGAFLMRGVRSYYLGVFYKQMQAVFSDVDLADDMRSAASEGDTSRLADIIRAYSGQLGIDGGTRDYYVLDGATGGVITGSGEAQSLTMTPNILTALAGSEGYASDATADYMDVALPVTSGTNSYIVYIIDNKSTVSELSTELFEIILKAMLVGVVIAILMCLLLAKTMVTPIQELTRAAEKVASGDFEHRLEASDARDEIGVLSRTFSDMALQLENNISDLQKSEQMRREFVANVSHELRTPITSIRSYAETLQETEDVPPELQREFLGVIVNESDRMTKIVQDLLTLSRFDAGSIEFDFESFSFEQSVRDVYSAVALEAQNHNHSFTLEISPDIPDIRGDRARVEQVLMNMVSNAIKYTRDGGRIKVSAGVEGDNVWASVRDNGIGIPKEDIDRVFDRFYRVDKARSRESGGTGLGLSIAQEIVARHNGTIGIESRVGKGTVITVTLPIGGPANE
jgi:signal transduction histidine kinase